MLRPHRVSIVVSLAFALAACKIEVNTANADDAKANADAAAADADAAATDATDATDEASEAAADTTKDPSTTLTAAPKGETTTAPADPGSTLSAGPAASCGEHKAGESWKDDCNTCKCSDDGTPMCTRMKCASPD